MPLGIPCTVDGEDGTIAVCEECLSEVAEPGSTLCTKCLQVEMDRESDQGERFDQDFGSDF